MADWQEWLTTCIMSLIFAYMLSKLISIIHSFHKEKLRIERGDTETHEPFKMEGDRTATNSESTSLQAVEKPVNDLTMSLETDNKIRGTGAIETAQSDFDSQKLETASQTVAKVDERSLLSDDDDWEDIDGSDLSRAFGIAASCFEKNVMDPSVKVSNETKLKFYGLYKQATEGPCASHQPAAYRTSDRAKWNAWKSLGQLSPEEAMQHYIALLSELWPKWNQDMQHDKGSAGASQIPTARSTRQAPTMGPVFSTMLRDPSEQEGLDEIHKCAKAGDLAGLERLLQSNVAVDQKDGDGRTALHWASDQGHLEIVKLLISHGADINARLQICHFLGFKLSYYCHVVAESY
ncbi:hypothetical protein KP509_1Z299800 [Ceratopteris richardii]|nr:hypothetical protein KP509_1Z299800 [Ceratopteris richardii]KAH6554886.1 hypothetical protein KP509_1Z299800 [Ceratopteris richardii]